MNNIFLLYGEFSPHRARVDRKAEAASSGVVECEHIRISRQSSDSLPTKPLQPARLCNGPGQSQVSRVRHLSVSRT